MNEKDEDRGYRSVADCLPAFFLDLACQCFRAGNPVSAEIAMDAAESISKVPDSQE